MNDQTADACADRMLDILGVAGRAAMIEALTEELRTNVAPIAIERRYLVALGWLERVQRQFETAGETFAGMTFLRILITATGDAWDRTILTPTGVQQWRWN